MEEGEAMSDHETIVCGANCTWWDSIDKTKTLRGGIPCCPFCGSVLFQYENLDQFMENVDAYEKNGHPNYRSQLLWQRGKCFKTMDEGAKAMKEEAKS